MNIHFMKFVDSVLGRAATRLLPSPGLKNMPEAIRSMLFIRPGGIGDAVLLIPSIVAVKEKYPDTTVTVLAEKRNGSVFGLCHEVDNLLLYDNPRELLSALRTRYDVVIDTEQWHRLSAVIARMTGAPIVIGYATNERRKLFTHLIQYSHDKYEVDSFFDLLAPLDIIEFRESYKSYLDIPANDEQRAESFLADLLDTPFFAIFPGASVPERHWGVEKFRLLAERLHAQGFPVVVVGGKEDISDGESIVAGKYGLNLAGETSLIETAAVINRSAVLVSGDSGILHIGVGLGKPTISLFGPGRAKKWAPRDNKHIVINKCLPCSPCTRFGYTPKCSINAKCIADINVDEVMEAVDKLMINNGLEHRG